MKKFFIVKKCVYSGVINLGGFHFEGRPYEDFAFSSFYAESAAQAISAWEENKAYWHDYNVKGGLVKSEIVHVEEITPQAKTAINRAYREGVISQDFYDDVSFAVN